MHPWAPSYKWDLSPRIEGEIGCLVWNWLIWLGLVSSELSSYFSFEEPMAGDGWTCICVTVIIARKISTYQKDSEVYLPFYSSCLLGISSYFVSFVLCFYVFVKEWKMQIFPLCSWKLGFWNVIFCHIQFYLCLI